MRQHSGSASLQHCPSSSSVLVWLVSADAVLTIAFTTAPVNQPFDVVILNGHIIDGSGNPWYAGDIGIRADRIAAIGNLKGAGSKTRPLTHADWSSHPALLTCLGNLRRRC